MSHYPLNSLFLVTDAIERGVLCELPCDRVRGADSSRYFATDLVFWGLKKLWGGAVPTFATVLCTGEFSYIIGCNVIFDLIPVVAITAGKGLTGWQ